MTVYTPISFLNTLEYFEGKESRRFRTFVAILAALERGLLDVKYFTYWPTDVRIGLHRPMRKFRVNFLKFNFNKPMGRTVNIKVLVLKVKLSLCLIN
jgi:hypothetical protein